MNVIDKLKRKVNKGIGLALSGGAVRGVAHIGVLEILEEEGIPVIRIGVMSSPSLLRSDEIMAGPWHSAFGFLVRSGIHQAKVISRLHAQGVAGQIRLRVPSAEIPLVRGYKNRGLRLIEEKTGAKVTGVMPDEAVPSGQVRVDVL